MKVALLVLFFASLTALVGCELGVAPTPTSPHVPAFGTADPVLRALGSAGRAQG